MCGEIEVLEINRQFYKTWNHCTKHIVLTVTHWKENDGCATFNISNTIKFSSFTPESHHTAIVALTAPHESRD